MALFPMVREMFASFTPGPHLALVVHRCSMEAFPERW
jgi:hypothetical protein